MCDSVASCLNCCLSHSTSKYCPAGTQYCEHATTDSALTVEGKRLLFKHSVCLTKQTACQSFLATKGTGLMELIPKAFVDVSKSLGDADHPTEPGFTRGPRSRATTLVGSFTMHSCRISIVLLVELTKEPQSYAHSFKHPARTTLRNAKLGSHWVGEPICDEANAAPSSVFHKS